MLKASTISSFPTILGERERPPEGEEEKGSELGRESHRPPRPGNQKDYGALSFGMVG